MSRFLNPRGRSTYGIGVCARCNRKFSLDDLSDDPNYPGLKVCMKDMDDLDPYRLPARDPDPVNLPFNRPDAPLITTSVAPGDPGWAPPDSEI